MTTIVYPKTCRCPVCKAPLNAASPANEEAAEVPKIEDGDLTICLYCGTPLEVLLSYDPTRTRQYMTLRPLDPETMEGRYSAEDIAEINNIVKEAMKDREEILKEHGGVEIN